MRVKELLKERGITSKELAAKMGMSETGLSISISDSGNPSLSRLKQIASILEVEVSDLFKSSNSPTITCPHCGKSIELEVRKE